MTNSYGRLFNALYNRGLVEAAELTKLVGKGYPARISEWNRAHPDDTLGLKVHYLYSDDWTKYYYIDKIGSIRLEIVR